MSRIFRCAIVLTLVIGSVAATNSFENPYCIVSIGSASGTNVTWEMLNQTIDELKIWIEGNFDFFSDYLNSTNNRINETVDEIKQNFSELLYGNATVNQSFSEYLLDNMNVTVNVDDITLEGVNETNVLGKLDTIIDTLGYNNSNSTVYQNLEDILGGLKDKNGYYILKDSSGYSNLAVLAAEFLIPTIENQGNLSEQINNTFNATRAVIENHHTATQGFMATEAEWIAEHSGDPWAMISGILLIILTFIFVVWKRFLKPRFFPDYNEEEQLQMQREQQYHENPPLPQNQQSPTPRKQIPIMNRLNRNAPPCYLDGITYDGNNLDCGSCRFRDQCMEVKIRTQGFQGQDQNQDTIQQGPKQPEVSNINPSAELGDFSFSEDL